MHYSVETMALPQEIAKDITAILPHVKLGTLRFWGEWFGRPFDNGHWLVGCHATDECLRLQFNENEVLAVEPFGARCSGSSLAHLGSRYFLTSNTGATSV
jgi:hypothetical protein